MRFADLSLHDSVPDTKTIWLFREQLTRSGASAELFEQLDQLLHARDYLAMSGQIIDATVIEVRKPRLSCEEKVVLRRSGTSSGW